MHDHVESAYYRRLQNHMHALVSSPDRCSASIVGSLRPFASLPPLRPDRRKLPNSHSLAMECCGNRLLHRASRYANSRLFSILVQLVRGRLPSFLFLPAPPRPSSPPIRIIVSWRVTPPLPSAVQRSCIPFPHLLWAMPTTLIPGYLTFSEEKLLASREYSL